MKPAIVIAAATMALAPMLTSSAEARGLRIGLGFGIGVAAGIGMYGTMHHHSRPRTETVVNGRYRCCTERPVAERYERPSKPAPRPRRDEESEREEKQEKKVIRKKPAKSEETVIARARPAKPAQDTAVRTANPATVAPAVSPAVSSAAVAPAAAMVAAPEVLAQVDPAKPMELARVADEPVGGEAKRLPRVQTVGIPAPTVAADSELNCRKYVPTLGQAIAVSCME